ncbi:MAG: type II secretion system secretin GspD [Lentisphaerae bacterium]|nr:type II secretion system secretin GspD [Lentisphaerota bacterium]
MEAHTKRNLRGRLMRLAWLGIAVACLGAMVPGAALAQTPSSPFEDDSLVPRLKFNNATVDIVLDDYAEKTARTLLKSPGVPRVNISLKSEGDLNLDEYLQAIETVLSMNGIVMLPVGEKFLKVVPVKQARAEGMPIGVGPVERMAETDRLVSQMIPLNHIDIAEARKAIETLKHAYGQIHMFERTNSILLTDTAVNINRITEILAYIDQPVEAREEPHVVVIRYAKAGEIKQKLEELIADQQKEAQKSTVPAPKRSGSPGVQRATRVTGVIRAPKSQEAPVTMAELVEMAERGIISGKVKIIADDRTNVLIIITRPENMAFFEKIISVLDVETDPDVVVKIIRLEYADAESVASTLNTLIGKPDKASPEAVRAGTGKKGASSADLKEYVARLEEGGPASAAKSKIGELSSENIKILPDKRTNALLIMASKGDFAAIEELIKSMDMMLSQVLIEVVIFKIGLLEENERGMDWIQRAMVAYEEQADGTRRPLSAFAGTAGGGADRARIRNPLAATSIAGLAGAPGNLTYYFTFFNMNIDAIVKLVASDNRSQIVASPRILTTDNKEATIKVTKEKYFFKGLKFVSTSGSGGGEWVDDVVMRPVGNKLTVTPHINEKKFVVMEINQTLEEEGTGQDIVGGGGITTTWPTIDSSELTASIAVRSGETIVLGGLVSTTLKLEESKVPILGDIPVIGNLFKSKSRGDNRSEIVVFITPHVLDTPEEIYEESMRRQDAMEAEVAWPEGSHSKLAERAPPAETPVPERKSLVERIADSLRALRSSKKEEPARETPLEPVVPEEAEPEPGPEPEPEPMPVEQEADVGQEAPSLAGDEDPDLDPETAEYIERQTRRYRRSLQKVDGRIERDLEESGNL